MAKTGYLFLAKGYHAREEDVAWMKDYGCDSIIVVMPRGFARE